MAESKSNPAPAPVLKEAKSDALAQYDRRKARLERYITNATPDQKSEYQRQLADVDQRIADLKKQK